MKTVSKKLLSLLLVVLLLAAAVPFQAFADTTVINVVVNDEKGNLLGTGHINPDGVNAITKTQIDNAANAELAKHEGQYVILAYYNAAGSEALTFDANGELKLQGDDKSIIVVAKSNAIPPVTGRKLTLDGNGGNIDGYGAKAEITVVANAEGKYLITTLPAASKSDYTFNGWFTADGTRYEVGSEITSEDGLELIAQFSLITKNIKVKGVKTTQSLESAKLISEYNATPNQNLLAFLKEHATATVQDQTPEGYQLVTSGGSIVWYNYDGSTTLSNQLQVTSAAQEVLVKYQPKTFTLYFQVGTGASVDPTSKTVTYDSKVGTLPTPKKSGEVFMGWFDSEGVQYTSETVYKVNGNTTLTARWQSESSVLLRIYLSPNTSTPDRIVDITGKVASNSVGRTEVESVVTKYYTGSNMKLIGLFSDATWASYRAGSITEGTPNVTIQEDVKTTNVHVVVTGATNKPNSNNNSSSSTTATTKPADKDNPKTGDSMLIYAASAVMIVAAAALVTVQVLRKKRTY